MAASFPAALCTIFDWFIPDHICDGESDALRRARLVVAFSWILVPLALLYASFFLAMSSPIGAASLVVGGGAGLVALAVMRGTGSHLAAGNLLTAAFFGALTALTYRLGGHGAYSLAWYAAVPVVALSTAGRRSAVFWFTAAVVSLATYYVLCRSGYCFPNDLTAHNYQLLGLLSCVGLSALILGLALVYETAMSRALAELRSAESELLREKDFSDSAIASLSGIFYLFDDQGRLLRWNENLAGVTGYSPDELTNMGPLDFFSEQYQGVIERSVADVFTEGQATTEACLRTKGGTDIPYLLSGKRVVIAGNVHLVGVGIDIAQRKKTEEALRESSERLRLAFQAARMGTWEWDVADNRAAWSPEVCDIFGVEPEEFGGTFEAYASFAAPDAREELEQKVKSFLDNARESAVIQYEHEIIRGDGSTGWVEVRGTVFLDEEGQPTRMTGICTDVTARKQAEMELAATKGMLEAAIAQSPSGILIADAPDVTIRVANRAALGIRGGEPSVLTGIDVSRHAANWRTYRPDGSLCPPEQLPLSRAVLRGEVVQNEEVIIRDELDNDKWVSANAAPIRDSKGRVTAGIVVFHDITARKQAEAEQDRARNAAEAATRTKSEFLANMSHEIRTPMTAILGFADVLIEGAAGPEQLDAAKTIKQNGEYLLGIINDILDLSKIEAGKLEVARTPCSPCQILSEVASLMRVRARAKNLPLQVEYAGPIPQTVQSDPTRLRQILINLIGNAVKFTEVGKIRLVVRLLEAGADEPKLRIDVIDTGIGMTEPQIARLFKPFQQADNSTTRKFGGTGLGLTISKRLAGKLGGGIAVKSTPGEGSTFTVTIGTGPLDGVALLDSPSEGQLSTDADKRPKAAESKLDGCVLLAEDGPDNQRLIAFLLKKAGAEVTVAENGKIAHDLALKARDEGTPFDVILMDMQMPVMDGYDATARLREASYAGPIIALTAHAMSTDRDKCLAAGCDDYMTKPIDREALLALIVKYAASKKRC